MGFRPAGLAEAPNEAPRSTREPAASAPAVFQVIVRRHRWHNPETGFFVSEASPVGAVPPLPPALEREGLRLPSPIILRGTSQAFQGSDLVGATVEVAGSWEVDDRHGLQFAVAFVQNAIPTTPEALEKYLASGQLKGIGPATARAIVDRWGIDAIRILDNTPERLSEIPGLNEAKVKGIAEAWKVKREIYQVVSFLGLHGIGETLAMRARDALGAEGLEEKIRKNPYLLTEIEGIGFKKADDVAISLGFPEDSPQRLAAALLDGLRKSVVNQGHTAVPADQWMNEASVQLGRPLSEVREMCQRLINAHHVVLRMLEVATPHGVAKVACVSPRREALSERQVAKDLHRLLQGHVAMTLEQQAILMRIVDDPARRLDPSQKQAAWNVFQQSVGILTGGPGTGKTTTLRSIVEAAQQMGKKVVLSAPTGRAAKRMEEAIGMEAMTMHRRLGFAPGQGFKHNESNPMAGEVFVIDEASMVDTFMMSAWLRAIPSGAVVLLVGDADQLPSVGAGDVLRDLIVSGAISVSRLTRVHRQAEGSGIAWNASQVLAGRAPAMNNDPWTDDFAFVKASDDALVRQQLVEIIEGFLRQGVRHQDIQVLCPQRTLDCGTESLNALLRGILNPHRPDAERLAEGLCVGERMMQVKNNYDLEVFNGDMGVVTKIFDDGDLEMEMEDGRLVRFPKKTLKDLQFGYAITVHKSQGGERPVVIMPIVRGHSFSLNRNLLYTAITRGKNRVILIGDGQVAMRSAKKKDDLVRITGLLNEMAIVGVPRLASPPRPGMG